MHPAIRLTSVAALGAAPEAAAADEAPPPPASAVGRARARAEAVARRAGAAVLDRVGDRAAAATSTQVDQLRDELARTRAELTAEIELLRAELDGKAGAAG